MDFKAIKALKKTYEVDKIALAKGAFGVVRRAKLKGHGNWEFAVKEINTEKAADDIGKCFLFFCFFWITDSRF